MKSNECSPQYASRFLISHFRFYNFIRSHPPQLQDDEVAKMTSETLIGSIIAALTDPSALPSDFSGSKSDDIVIPPHLQDLQEQDLPEEQRGLVLSEISLFRERSARRDRPPQVSAPRQPAGGRVWGQPSQDGGRDRDRERERDRDREKERPGESHGLASKPVGFVKEQSASEPAAPTKTDEERERERLEARRREEDNSFRDVRPFRLLFFVICADGSPGVA
jgi:RNA-binding protein 25